jgi:translocation-and-assembly-module (TAM) inner membrane subunit TamB-like protein
MSTVPSEEQAPREEPVDGACPVPRRSRIARIGRRFRRGITLGLLLIVLVAVLVAQTGRGQALVLQAALSRVRGALAGELTVQEIRSGSLLAGATLTGVRLDAAGGRRFLDADSVVVRYSLLSFLAGGSPIRSTTVWGLDLEISRYAGDEGVNVAQVLADGSRDTTAGPADQPLELGRIGVREGRVRILTPSDARSSGPIVEGPNGEVLRRLSFDDVDLDLEDVVLAPSSAVVFEARLASFSSNISILREPLVVREAFGRASFGAQGIRLEDAAFRLPGTLLRGDLTVGPRRPGAAWTFHTELGSDGWGELRDLGWIDPRIPSGRFRGGVDIAVERAVVVDFDRLEVELEASNVIADGEVRFGDVMSMRSMEVTASPITLDRLEPWLGARFPFEGWLSGKATFSGTFQDLTASGRVTLVPTGFGGNATTADFAGTIHRGERPGATDFEASFESLNYTVLESIWPDLPFAGTGSGRLELGGRVDAGLRIVADFTHQSDSAATSRVAVRGLVRRESGDRWITDLRGDLVPLAVGLFSSLAPGLGLQGSVSGPVRVEGPLEELSIQAELEAEEGRVVLAGELNLRSPRDGYRLEADADSLLLASFTTLLPERTSWSGGLVLEGSGLTLDSIEGSAVVTMRDSRVGPVRVDTAAAGLRLSGGVLITESLDASIAGIDVTGRGRLGLAPGRWGNSQIEFEGSSLVGLRPLLMGLGDSVLVRDGLEELEREFLRVEGIEPDTLPTSRDVRLEGAVAGAASISGEIRDFDLGVVVEILDGAYKVNQVDTARIGLTASGLPASPSMWQVGATARGIVWQDREFDQGGFEAAMFEQGGNGRIEVVRRPGEEYRAVGSFRLDSLGGEVGLTDAEVRIDDELWSLTRPARIAWDGATLAVDSLRIARTDDDPMKIVVDGTLTRGGESDFRLDVEGLHVARVLHVAQLEELEIGGHLNVGVTVNGPSEAPNIRGTFRMDGPRYGTMELSRVEGTLEYADRSATFRVKGWDGTREAIDASGTMPLDLSLAGVEDRVPDAPLDIQITADSLDAAIALSYLTTLEQVLGVVSADVHIGGTPDAPEPQGVITLSDAEWSIEAIGVRHTGVNGEVRLRPDRTVDVSLSLRGLGSSQVTGTILLDPFSDPSLDLTFSFERFEAVARPDIEGFVSGRFVLSGSYQRPFAQGALTVDQGTIYVDEFQRAARVVDLRDPFLFERGITVDTTALVAQPLLAGIRNPFFDNLRVNVDLSVPRDTWLRSIETNVEMGGDLLVRYDRSAGDFVLLGELQALRGSHLVLGRNFDLESGTVSFIGRPGLNPDLNIRAFSRIRRPNEPPLNVTAVVAGTLVQPVVTLSTDEAGLVESDLVSYLIFGQPSGALGGNQGQVLGQLGRNSAVSALVQGSITYVGGALANRFGAAIARGIKLDYLSVQQTGGIGGGGAGSLGFGSTQLEAGRYVGDDVFVVLVFRPTTDQVENANFLRGARVEWAFTDDYNVEGFLEDRFLRTGSQALGAAGLVDNRRIWGVFMFREWGY